jgi:hypothetical protein
MRLRSIALTGLFVVAGCTGAAPATEQPSTVVALGSSTPAAPTPAATGTATAAPSSSATSAPIDLSVIEACTLLDEAAVQQLTGTTLDFEADEAPPFASGVSCFWGVIGHPQYVEIQIFKRPNLDGYQFQSNDTICTTEPITDAGIEAVGGTCSTPQQKVYVLVTQDDVVLSVLVNEPERPLEPADLLDTARSRMDIILGG